MKMHKNIAVIILAAGKSTRMKSDIPKALHPICARPMIEYVLDLVRDLKIKKAVAVLGFKHERVRKYLRPGIDAVIQKRLLGTADAVKAALPKLRNFKGTILVLYADNPLLKKETINKLLKFHAENNLDATLLTAHVSKPAGYGRIKRDKYASISGIIEEKDADDVQKEIKEINTGIICFNSQKLFSSLKEVRANNQKKEFYLTDLIGIFYKKGYLVDCVKLSDINEALGINSRIELAQANAIMQERLNQGFMKNGVTLVDPGSTFIGFGAKIGQGSTIYPFTVIESNVTIGRRCSVGPFAHLREGSELKDDVIAGNFLESVRTKISSKTIAKHFCYLGDAAIGRCVNIGAGTVIANFDGKKKNKTIIKDNVFIGSDTVLVAPVKVGRGAKTGAGSAVINDVLANSVVVGVPARTIKPKR